MKLLIHVGLHRAASTSLQQWLRQHVEALKASGIFVHAGISTGHAPSPFGILTGREAAAMGVTASAEYIRASLQEMSGCRGGIVSDENLLGDMPRPSIAPFARLRTLCGVFDALRHDHEIIPVIILRRHEDWLQSAYRTYQARGGDQPFASFVASSRLQDLRFSPVLSALGGGDKRPIIVDSLEQIAADSGARLMAKLAEALEIPGLADGRLPQVNRSFGPIHRRVTVALGKHHAMLAGHGGMELRELLAMPSRVDAEEVAKLVHDRAVKVAWNQTPGRRMNRASALHAKGTPTDRRMPLDLCRGIVSQALQAKAGIEDTSLLPLDEFAADRREITERWLPEWRT